MLTRDKDYWTLLEQLRWHGQPQCPYCQSKRSVAIKSERRYHCNHCFTSYSVTVGTLFHKSRVDLRKWFKAIELLNDESSRISVRGLAKEISVSKNTAESMILRIREAQRKKDTLFLEIVDLIESKQELTFTL